MRAVGAVYKCEGFIFFYPEKCPLYLTLPERSPVAKNKIRTNKNRETDPHKVKQNKQVITL